MTTIQAIEIFCDSASGVYIPQRFAKEVNKELLSGVDRAELSILESGPDHEQYWDVWNNVENNAVVTTEGHKWRLYQDGDLFLVCDDLLTDQERSEFFGES